MPALAEDRGTIGRSVIVKVTERRAERDSVERAAGRGHVLLDEAHLLVHPIAVRNGMRLFEEGVAPTPLRLISSETFQTGVVNLVYGPAE
jgi:hypothetical protein